MSAFGDNTPKQEMLENLDFIKNDFQMSWLDFFQALTEVFTYLIGIAKYEEEHEEREP